MKAFIIVRDRYTYAAKCAAALASAGLDVVIADHGTTYPPAVQWLADVRKGTSWQVFDCGGGNPRELWNRPWFRQMVATDRYVVTDPDVVPSEDCPADWLEYLSGILDRYPFFHKVGLGLRLDRIPLHYYRRQQALDWEGQFWQNKVEGEDEVYNASIDTTLALHVPLMEMGTHTFTALRTGHPYVADHLAWYEDFANLPEEIAWYYDHAEPGICNWAIPGRSAQFG